MRAPTAALLIVALGASGCGSGPRWFPGTIEDACRAAKKRETVVMVDFTADW